MTPQEREARGPIVGRPPLPIEEKLHGFSIRLTLGQYEKLMAHGGRKAIRDWLDTLSMPRKTKRTKQ